MFTNTGMVTLFKKFAKKGSASYLFRQVPGQETNWLKFIEKLLHVAEDNSLDIHICRKYLLKDGKMVFGWHIGLNGKMEEIFEILQSNIDTKPATTVKTSTTTNGPMLKTISSGVGSDGRPYSVEEMPLPHVTKDLNAPNAKGRGATGAK